MRTIALERSGNGSALILVHGTGADRTGWAGVRPRLAVRFTIYALDRRGRGKSGRAPNYDFAREAEDIIAVVVLILMNTMLKIPLAAIEKARPTPAWAGPLAAAHTIPRS